MTAIASVLLFGGRDFRVARSYRLAFVMTVASTLMSLITFRFISKLIGEAPALAKTGDYFTFVVVGLVLSQILEGALAAPASQVRQEQVQGTLEVLATQPMSVRALTAGWAAYPVISTIATSVTMMAMAGAFGFRLNDPHWLAAIVIVALSTAAFLGIGVVVAAFVVVFQQGAALSAWITAGMSLVSGVFFPVTLFPGWMQALAQLSPLTHATHALRAVLLAGHGVHGFGGDLLALALWAVLALPAGVYTLGRALDRARANGTLGTY